MSQILTVPSPDPDTSRCPSGERLANRLLLVSVENAEDPMSQICRISGLAHVREMHNLRVGPFVLCSGGQQFAMLPAHPSIKSLTQLAQINLNFTTKARHSPYLRLGIVICAVLLHPVARYLPPAESLTQHTTLRRR